MSNVATIARNDFRNVRRSRILWGVVAIYVAFMALLFYASGTGTDPNVRDTLFGAVFLTTLVLPLVAIAASYLSVAGERESNTIRFLLSQPASRRSVVLGKFLSRGALLTTALVVAVLVGVAFVLAFYPALEPVALAKFTGLTLLLVGAYVSVSVALSTVSASRSRAIALTMAFYFVTDILSVVNAFSVKAAMEWVLGEVLGLAISAELYEGMSTVVSPAKAYVNSTLAIFSPENFQRIQIPGELPFYLETWFMVVLLAAWIVVPLLLAMASFDRAEIA
jgi:ABC-2 type transport system permease protein